MSTPVPIRVLILEDNPSDAELMIDALGQAGLEPRWERVDTERDFAARLTQELDLILSDYALPQFSGLQALHLVRSRGLDVPFILVSGSIGEDIAVNAMREGADDYFLKDRLARLGPAVLQALERRRLLAEKDRAESARRESDRRFSDILDNVQLVSLMLDREARITYCNDYMLQLTGWQRENVLGRDWFELFAPPELVELKELFAALIAERPEALHHDSQILTRSGERRLIRWSNSVLHSGSGKVIGTASIGEDITEQQRAEIKIRGLNRVYAMLSGINTLIVRVNDRQTLFDEACRIAVEYGKFGIAWIGELNTEKLEVVPIASAGLDANDSLMQSAVSVRADAPDTQSVLPRAVRGRRPVYHNDIGSEADVGGARRKEAVRRGYQSVIVLPLLVEDTVVATFSVFAKERGFFDDDEVRLLTELADNIAFGLDHMARQHKIEKLSRVRALSGEINAAIVRIRERETLLQETCRIAAEHGKFELVWIGELDIDRQTVRPVAWQGFSQEAALAVNWDSISAAQGTLAEAIQTRRAAVRNDIGSYSSTGKLREEALETGCLSTVCLPLIVDNMVVALITLFAAGKDFFDAAELALLNELAADVSFALQAIAQHEKVEYLSYYDPLTGLPNRTLFVDRTGQQMRAREGEQPRVAVILLNIERFRNVNETFGRHGGDELLRLVAQRLEGTLHGKESLARIGPDSFAVIMRGIRDSAALVHALEAQVLGCFATPFIVGGSELRAAAKVGIALHPADGETADTLFNNAEAALKKARSTGERYLFYAADMNAQAAQALSLETRLRKAVEAKQFVLHYQPKIELASGRVCGLEALIRWQDPESGLVAPGHFIPLLEETGLIFEVGKWTLERALADHREWAARGCAPPRVAVNVSAIQLRRKDFVNTVFSAVADQGDNPDALELEVTESLLMHDVQASIRTLSVLRGMGIHISMDDFGTGFSSLNYIARLPMNAVKISRSFISTMAVSSQDMSIVSTIIALARSLNLRVIAEGVETEEQLRLLKLLKCDEVQGWLLSRALPAEQVFELLGASAAGTVVP